MNENKKPITKSVYRSDFKIPQLVKLVGIRNSRHKENMSRFISPIYGSKVSDKVVIPNQGEGLGDNTRRLDAFRVNPKLQREKDSYSEFNIITNDSRGHYLGGKIVDDNNEEVIQTNTSQTIRPITNNSYSNYQRNEEQVERPKTSDFTYEERPSHVQLKPIDSKEDIIEEPKIKLHENPSGMIVKSNFEDILEDEPVIQRPQVQTAKVKEVVNNYKPNKKYVKPHVTMFKKVTRDPNMKPAWLLEQIEVINSTLKDFGIEAEVIGSTKGPTVTRYELALQPGVNVSRVNNIFDNLMMNLKAKSLRIEAPIPGKPFVGLEVPNVNPEIVAFGNVVDDPKFLEAHDKPLQVALGVDIDGENVYVDIAKMPHGLIAGATNSGKSVCINTVLSSLLIKNSPDELKLILIDPKMVELNAYNDLPHLVTPVITDARMASQALKWSVEEMEKRYKLFAENRSKDIKSFNDNVKRGSINHDLMPYLVIVIDELADLMMAAANDVEESIQRLTQKARAAGIHLIVATQRPTTDVVKGTIKSNIPVRIAFKVASFVDSTTILDGAGAENLLGKGDMLLKEQEIPVRLQGAYIPDDEIYKLTDYIRDNSEVNYIFDHEDLKRKAAFKVAEKDELFDEVAYFVVEEGTASINKIMTSFSISFNRAQSIVSMLESYNVVEQNQGTRARTVLVTLEELDGILKDDN